MLLLLLSCATLCKLTVWVVSLRCHPHSISQTNVFSPCFWLPQILHVIPDTLDAVEKRALWGSCHHFQDFSTLKMVLGSKFGVIVLLQDKSGASLVDMYLPVFLSSGDTITPDHISNTVY